MLNMNWQNFPLSHAARAFCGHYWNANYSENFWLKIIRQNAQLGEFLCLVTFLSLINLKSGTRETKWVPKVPPKIPKTPHNLFGRSGPNVSTTPLRQWGFWQCLPFSWTTLRGKHCRHPIAIMGVVDTFGPSTKQADKAGQRLENFNFARSSVMRVGSDTFGNSIFQNFPNYKMLCLALPALHKMQKLDFQSEFSMSKIIQIIAE